MPARIAKPAATVDSGGDPRPSSPQSPPRAPRREWISRLDGLGIAVSATCAAHCVLTPLLLVLLPLVGVIELVIPHEFEQYARAAAIIIAVLGIGMGAVLYQRVTALPYLALGVVSFGVLGVVHLHGVWEVLLSVLGSAMFIYAHYLNSNIRHRVDTEPTTACLTAD